MTHGALLPELAGVIGLAVLLATGLAILWISGVAFTIWLLTHPPRRTYSAAVARARPGDPSELPDNPRFESWTFASRAMQFPVWDIRGDSSAGPTVILTHGWADSRIGSLVRLKALLPVASRILAWDLSGHGEAPGMCRLGTAEVQDLLALIESAKPERFVLMGWSLGAGISIEAAVGLKNQASLLAVIAEAPYRYPQTPATNVVRARGLPAALLIPPAFMALRVVFGRRMAPGAFDRVRLATDLTIPALIIHGEQDAICPSEDSRQVSAACRGRLLEVPRAGHNDLWTEPEFLGICAAAVQHFIAGLRAS